MNRHIYIALFLLLLAPQMVVGQGTTPQKPKLVVNIVVSGMRYDYMERFGANFSDKGFRRFTDRGVVCSKGRYNYMQTNTVAGLATLTTGADPAVHGVVSPLWIDNVTHKPVTLINDPSVVGFNSDAGQYSPANLVVSTLGDQLKQESPRSNVVTIAWSAESAVAMGGFQSQVYWVDAQRAVWSSSTGYMTELPQWVNRYNDLRPAEGFMDFDWRLQNLKETYRNKSYTIFDFADPTSTFNKIRTLDFLKRKVASHTKEDLKYLPVANTMVADFVRQAVVYEDLGRDENVDLLNICFDAPRYIGELFGPESMEVEDMYYRLDKDLGEVIDFIYAQLAAKDVLIVLTSDHGASNSYDNLAMPRQRFNSAQYRMIVNGFLNAQYGHGDWVVDFLDKQLFLNRDLIFASKLDIGQVQNQVATFSLQFSGVSHALSSTAMQSGYFADGYGRMVQNSFYPKRSGDVLLNLMPGWIVDVDQIRSMSGSMYDYDRHVPLMWLGGALPVQTIRQPIDMTSVAPTLAYIMQIAKPVASGAPYIDQIVEGY